MVSPASFLHNSTSCSVYIWSLMVHFIHVLQQINGFGGVTGFVVIPGHDFDKVVVEGDARLGVEDGGVAVAQEVGGNDGLIGVV